LFSSTCLQILKAFSEIIFIVALVSNRSDDVAPRLLTCARQVIASSSRGQAHQIITSASRPRVRHCECQIIITNVIAPRVARVDHAGIATRPLHQDGIDRVTNFDLRRDRCAVVSSSQ
jgi:hypothetical protein